MKYKKLLISVTIFILFYLLIINIWYYNPTWFFGINYKVKDNVKIDKIVDTPSLIVVDHGHHGYVDVMIMSDEILKSKTKIKFNLLSRFCVDNPRFNYFYYRTKYNIVEVEKGTVSKCIDLLNKKENVVVFLTEKMAGKGIYHILKETKAPLVIVKKKNIKLYKEDKDNIFRNKIRLNFEGEYEIEYKKLYDYNTDKKPEEFMNYIKNNLFD